MSKPTLLRARRSTARAVVAILLATLSSHAWAASTSTSDSERPASRATKTVAGLSGPAEIVRDDRGIAHIRAALEADLYFAQGYATASDRLWQLDLLRRTARGELAEIFGETSLASDREMRVLGFSGLAAASVSRLEAPIRASLESYAAGVNAFVAECGETGLPAEFKVLGYRPAPWRVEDSMLVGKLLALALGTTWPTKLERAEFADLPAEQQRRLFVERSPLDVLTVGSDRAGDGASTPPRRARVGMPTESDGFERGRHALAEALARIGLGATSLAASNDWVVAGSRTASGRPMLANDPHLPLSVPSIWHLVHLSGPELDVAGAAAVGWPGVVLGHNAHVAWGATNMMADAQDLFLIRFDGPNRARYRSGAGFAPVVVRHEAIRVRTSFTSTDTKTVDQEVVATLQGPVVFDEGGRTYALEWSALDTKAIELQALYHVDRARSWREIHTALGAYTGPALNFVYCDVDGHIGYDGAGLVPRRSAGDGSVPYDASERPDVWSGYIKPADMPHALDPSSGIIVTANNRVVGDSYPYRLASEWSPPYRARRIAELLSAKRKLTAEDFRAIQADTYSYADAIFAAEVVKMARPRAADDKEWAAMLALFADWDGTASAESRPLAMSFAMRRTFWHRILEGAIGLDRAKRYHWNNQGTFVDWLIQERPAAWLPKADASYEQLVLECYRAARASLERALGADETHWVWGSISGAISFDHPLAAAPGVGAAFALPPLARWTGGSDETVNAGGDVSMRMIVDAADWDATRIGIVLGESGDPSSPHWKDQLESWRAVDPRPFAFSKAAVDRVAVDRLELSPR